MISRVAAMVFALVLFLVPCASATTTVPQSSPYNATGTTTASLSSNQTLGNANFAATFYCTRGDCFGQACTGATSITDNAGSDGGSANNTYVLDSNTLASETICVALGHAVNITATTSANTVSAAVSGTIFYQRTFAFEVQGLGVNPKLQSSGTTSSTGAVTSVATSGSCPVGSFAWAFFASGSSMTAGSGWTAIGTPAQAQLAEWQTVTSTGTVTATVTGGSGNSGATVACYTPAWTFINSTTNVGSGAVTAGNPGTSGTGLSVTAGNMLAVGIVTFTANGGHVSTCTDTAGDALTLVPGSQALLNGNDLEWWAGVTAGNAANVINCIWTQNIGNYSILLLQYSGNKSTSPGNTGAPGSCTSCTSVTSSSFTPNSGDLILAMLLVANGSLGFVAGSGYSYTSVTAAGVIWIENNTNLSATATSQTASTSITGGGGGTTMTFSAATFSQPASSTQAGAFLVGP